MRISTNMIFSSGGSNISDLQSALNRTQQQIASGQRILSPSDDPIGSARALVIGQSSSINDQLAVNRASARNSLSSAEQTLSSVTEVLHTIKTSLVAAGNGVLGNTERNFIATELQGYLDQMVGYANATDGVDSYLFSGFSSTTAPYTKLPGGAKYNGDQGQRSLQVDSSRQLPISEVGSQIFGNIRSSANQFILTPGRTNSGQTAVVVGVDPATAASLTGNKYSLVFDVTGLNFTVTNKDTGAVVVPSTVYTSPQTVIVDGMSLNLSNNPGVPSAGDSFTIDPGNQDIFKTLSDAINLLKTPIVSANDKLDFTAGLDLANGNIDKAMNNVLVARAGFGINLKALDSLDTAGESTSLIYKQEMLSIMDLDYAKAITELNQNQIILQAAQQSFMKTSGMSLFNYLN
jgi:flagellar hook-associated protein 3 FlgL